jgi:hypothetical protein
MATARGYRVPSHDLAGIAVPVAADEQNGGPARDGAGYHPRLKRFRRRRNSSSSLWSISGSPDPQHGGL